MNLFKVNKDDRKVIINHFTKKYKVEDFTLIDNELEVNEIEDEVLTESIASNLDIQPLEKENQNEQSIIQYF